jgi:lipopolysaccharide transport system ATP-binding protein
MDGPTRSVIGAYMDSFGAQQAQGVDLSNVSDRSGKGDIVITRMEILDSDGNPQSGVHSGDSFTIRLQYEGRRDTPNPVFAVRFYSNLGTLVAEASTWATCFEIPLLSRGTGWIDVEINSFNLMPGRYYIGLAAYSMFEAQDILHNAAVLDVEAADVYGTGRGLEPRFGMIYLPYRWKFPKIAVRQQPAPAADAGSVEAAAQRT